MIRSEADLGEEAEASGTDIGRRGVEQRAVIGERDVVQIVVRVVGIKRSPAAISALHPDDPLGRAINGPAIPCSVETVESKGDHGSVVKIRIIRVFVLKSPAAGSHFGAGRPPIPDPLQHLLGLEPIECPPDGRCEARVFDLHKRVTGEGGVPHRRKTRLAIGALAVEY